MSRTNHDSASRQMRGHGRSSAGPDASASVRRSRGATRWMPAALAMTALGIGCGFLGAYVVAPMLPAPGAPRVAAPLPTAPIEPTGGPTVSYPVGQNRVTIVEKPLMPPAPPREKHPEVEPGLFTTIEPALEETTTPSLHRSRALRREEPPKGETSPPFRWSGRDSAPEAGSRADTLSPEPHSPSTEHRTTALRTAVPPSPAAQPPPAEPAATVSSLEPAASASSPGTKPVGTVKGATSSGVRAEPAGSGGLYRVQVGRFANEHDAHALSEELKRDGFQPTIVRTGPEGKGLYRVQVGTFRLKENADRTIDRLRQRQLEPYLAEEEP